MKNSSIEEELTIQIEKINQTLTNFDSLNEIEAQNVLLDTATKIKEVESIFLNLKEDLKNKQKPEEITDGEKNLEDKKKHFQEIVKKFNEIQNNFQTKKSDKILIDEESSTKDNDIKSNEEKPNDLISSDENKNNIGKKIIENRKNESRDKIHNSIINQNIGNISSMSRANNMQIIDDEPFEYYNPDECTRKKCILISLSVFCVIALTFGLGFGLKTK